MLPGMMQGPGLTNDQMNTNLITLSNAIVNITSASFVQPAPDGTVSAFFLSTASFFTGQQIFIAGGGFYSVSVASSTALTLTNLGLAGNATPGTSIASGANVFAAGVPSSGGGGVSWALPTTLTATGTIPDNLGNFIQFLDLTAGFATVSMPANPTDNQIGIIKLTASTGGHTASIAGNGNPVDGGTFSFTSSTPNQSVSMIFKSAIPGWIVTSHYVPG